jgi:hypothetical protein
VSNDHWNTPPEIIEPSAMVLCGITLDPFSNDTSIVPATRRWNGAEVDGFERSWHDERVFCNGPWSRTKRVVEKCVSEWMAGRVHIISVIPTSLNASYWDHVDEAPARCRPRRRVSFMRDGKPVKGNRQDCVIVYWGPEIYRFRAHFRDVGEVKFG